MNPWQRAPRAPSRRILSRFAGRTVLVVSHVTPIKLLLAAGFAPQLLAQAPDLALAQPEQRGRPAPGEPSLGDLGHDLQSVQLLHRQPHRVRHRATVAAGRTFLLWRNRTFAFGAYTTTGSGSFWI